MKLNAYQVRKIQVIEFAVSEYSFSRCLFAWFL